MTVPRLLYSVPEFCCAAGISKAHFYRLRQRGLGPELLKIGDATRISAETANAWIARLETESRGAALRPRGKRTPTLDQMLRGLR